ncbi:unnamed protein product [Rotaria sordida]|uniref:Uncharacterized protein n=1 Tax=Rotaria sordida TaxID=392033 RepID=A0A819NDG3_9BILA|nr:unnamed protein product [Rotaria sordida]
MPSKTDKIDLKHIQIIKHLGYNLSDSYLEEGFLLKNCIGINMPKYIENVCILIANVLLDTDKIKETGSFICVNSTTKVTELELNGNILLTFNISTENIYLEKCNVIEKIRIGEDKFQKGQICTIVLFGNTKEILDEIEQSIHDVLCVLSKIIKEPLSASEILMTTAISQLAKKKISEDESFACALQHVNSWKNTVA